MRAIAGALSITVAAFIFYSATAAQDIIVGDTPEFITAAVTLGIAHPPGYPLFTMLGHLFSLLPIGPIPFRVNLLSVTCDAFTVGVVYLTALRLTREWVAAAMAALVLAVNSLFWSWALAAEVFPLNNLLAALLIYFSILWFENPERTKFLVAAAFVAGLGLAHHQTIVLLAPAILFLLWRQRSVLLRRPITVALCAIMILIGFLPYAYILFAAARHPFLNWGGVASFSDLFGMIARNNYGIGRLTNTAGFMAGSPFRRIFALLVSLGPLMGTLCLMGSIRAYRQQRWYFWFSAIGFASAGLFFVAIANMDLAREVFGLYVLERFFLLPFVIAAPLAAHGVLLIVDFASATTPTIRLSILRIAVAVIVVGALLTVFFNYRKIDQRRNHIARTYAEDIFSSVPRDSILLMNGDEIVLPLVYCQTVEGFRPDLQFVITPLLSADWYLKQIRDRYRDLIVPFDRYDGRKNNLKALVDANPGRSIIVIGLLPKDDSSLTEGYWLYPHGLVNIIRPLSVDADVDQSARDNEELLNRYRPPLSRKIKTNSFESNILFAYASPALRLGMEYERIGPKSESVKWYERALTMDPDIPAAREGLTRLGR